MDALTWNDFVELESRPLTVALRGVVSSVDSPEVERVTFAPPDYWRVETAGGELRYVANEQGHYQFRPGRGVSCFNPREPGRWYGGAVESTSFLLPRNLFDPRDDDNDFTRPVSDVEVVRFLGREAWRVTLAPPARKSAPIVAVLDAATGTRLAYQTVDGGLVIGFVEVEFDPVLPPDVFATGGGNAP